MIKRGESIVEVVVACGIISVLFVAVANMIVGSVKLNDDARIRMETVSLAQKELNSFIISGTHDMGASGGIDYDITTDSGNCRLTSDGTNINPSLSGTGTFYTKGVYFGCENATKDDLASRYPDKKCQYIKVSDLTSVETRGGLVRSDKFVVVESHVKWSSRALGFQEYIIKKLVRK